MKLPSCRSSWAKLLPTLAVAAFATVSSPCADAKPRDIDGDGIPNRIDPDVDGDGILNGDDRNVDGGLCKRGPKKGLYVGDRLSNGSSNEKDIDDDGLTDDSSLEKDIDGDDLLDDSPKEKDIDGDGVPDVSDDDIDGDDKHNGLDDDCDGDGKRRGRDHDDDGDDADDDSDDDDDNDGIEDGDDFGEIEIGLSRSGDAPSGSRVRVKIRKKPSGEIELEFNGRGLAAGTYDIVVDSATIGDLEMVTDKDRTEGETEFETTPDDEDENALPFDPSGLPVEIKQGGTVFFSGTVPTPI